jgi:hypothetical protein
LIYQIELESNVSSKKVTKSVRGMPRLSEARKDVISCDKLRVGANNRLSEDFRMGEPTLLKVMYFEQSKSKPGELKHLISRRKREQKFIPLVEAIEKGRAQTTVV